MRKHDPRWAYLMVNLATLIWASNIALGRALRELIGPASIVALRAAIAAVIYAFLLFTIYREQLRAPENVSRRDWWLYLGMGFTGVFAYPVFMYLALHYTTATNMALINATGPLVTMLLAAFMLKESITSNLIVGGMISLAGVGLIITNGSLATIVTGGLNRGDVIGLLIIGLWGLYSILARLAMRNSSSLRVTAISTWMALPMLLPVAWVEWGNSPPVLTLPLVLAILYSGIFPTVISFLLWNESVRMAGPNQAMAFYNTLVVYGAMFGILFLGEHITPYLLIGGALVIAGGLISAANKSLRLWKRELQIRGS